MSLLTAVHGRGTTAAKPAAAAANEGYLYFDTTLSRLERSNGATWDVIEGVSAPVVAHAYQSAAQALASYTYAALTFGAEGVDASGFHDNATNNSRMTVPAGLGGWYLLVASIYGAGSFGIDGSMAFRKNGTFLPGYGFLQSTRGHYVALEELAAGDYVEVMVSASSAQNTSGGPDTYFKLIKQ